MKTEPSGPASIEKGSEFGTSEPEKLGEERGSARATPTPKNALQPPIVRANCNIPRSNRRWAVRPDVGSVCEYGDCDVIGAFPSLEGSMRARTRRGRVKAASCLSAVRKAQRPFRVYSVVLLSVG